MGIESESPVDRQFKQKLGYRVGHWTGNIFGEEKAKEWAASLSRRGLVSRISGLQVDTARRLRKWRKIEPEPRTMDHLTSYTMKRREFFRLLGGIGVDAVIFGGYAVSKWALFDKLFNPTWRYDVGSEAQEIIGERTGEGAVDEEEVYKLYLIGPQKGAKDFCESIAIASQGINKDTGYDLDFTNFQTWGESELRYQIKYTARLWKHLKRQTSRNRIRQGIEEHVRKPENKKLQNDRLDRLENWINQNGPKGDLSDEDLKAFLTTPQERGGIGYSDVEWELLSDVLASWEDKNFSPDLKRRINLYNQEQGSQVRIP